ncbi:hypothetical protein RDV84_19290 [Lysobacter yananisis]|uniref:Methyltransferase n=1 Tax=Lysobacter yananisis TaxID=1003114 RepID=A0ABY9P4V5_9GAMM|nr:hypothetical protein [Lysobacter yananisis]WMT02088.1 hypothetical protein RDV84_19290 [Lysobacter yananisis]
MFNSIRFNSFPNTARRYGATLSTFARKHAAKIGVGTTALAVSGAASAQDSGIGAAALAAIGGLNGDVKAILVILVGVVFMFVLYGFIKRAK